MRLRAGARERDIFGDLLGFYLEVVVHHWRENPSRYLENYYLQGSEPLPFSFLSSESLCCIVEIIVKLKLLEVDDVLAVLTVPAVVEVDHLDLHPV